MGSSEQSHGFFRHFAKGKGIGGITKEAIHLNATIDRNDITRFKDLGIIRYSMYDHLINRHTQGCRESPISFESGDCAMIANQRFGFSIDHFTCYTGPKH